MSAWESFGSTYVEAATSTLPLHRLLIFAAGFLGSIALSNQTHLSIFESVARLNLSGLADLKSGPLSTASLANLFVGAGLVLVGLVAARILLWLVFAAASKATDLHKRASAARTTSMVKPSDPIADRQAMVALIDSSLEQPRSQIRAINTAMELSLALAIGFIAVAWWGNRLDVAIGLTLLLASVVLGIVSVRLFLAEYFGPAMLRAQLQGRRTPSPVDVHA